MSLKLLNLWGLFRNQLREHTSPYVFHLKTKVKLTCVIIFHCVCIRQNESYRLILVKAWSIWHTTSRFFTYLKNTELPSEERDYFPKAISNLFCHHFPILSLFLMGLCMWDFRKGQSLSAPSWLTLNIKFSFATSFLTSAWCVTAFNLRPNIPKMALLRFFVSHIQLWITLHELCKW